MKKNVRILLLTGAMLLSACGTGTGGEKEPSPTTSVVEENATPVPEATKTPETKDNVTDEEYLQYTFDLEEKHQVMDGFGGAFTWYTDQVFRTNNATGVLDAAFTDAKLSIIRFKNEYSYSLEGHAGNIGSMLQIYEAAAERAAEYGEEPTVLLSCWSPPADLKSNNSINGGGTLAKHEDGTYMYEEYAQWWVESVQFYRDWGVKIDYVSIQNECDFVASYDGCEFGMEESASYASYSKAFLAVYEAFQEAFGDEAPRMIAPETMTCEPLKLYGYVKEILDTKPESIYGVGYHLYIGGDSDEDNNTVKYDSFVWNFMDLEKYFGEYGYRRWQTEFFRGRGLQTAALINNAMTQGEMNAYIYWSAVWPNDEANFESGELIGIQNGKKVNEDGWILCADYYAVRHFSEFIRPGYTRIGTSMEGGVNFKNSAYLSEDGKTLVIVVINLGEEAQTLQLPAEGCTITGSEIYQSVLSIQDASKNVLYEAIGGMGEGNTVVLPGESITTMVLSLE